MQSTHVQSSLDRIEQCTDEAVDAMRNAGTNAPDELRQSVSEMHRQAREVRNLARRGQPEDLDSRIDTLEQTGDRAKEACRNAGSNVDPQLQSAVTRAHDEIANLKKQLH